MGSSTTANKAIFCVCCKREVEDFEEHKKTIEHQLNALFLEKKGHLTITHRIRELKENRNSSTGRFE